MIFPGRDPRQAFAIESESELCAFLREGLGPGGRLRDKAEVLILVAPLGGRSARVAPRLASCPRWGCLELPTSPKQLIEISPFASTCPETTLAHELGHAAGIGDHRENVKSNYMGLSCPRDQLPGRAGAQRRSRQGLRGPLPVLSGSSGRRRRPADPPTRGITSRPNSGVCTLFPSYPF
jgi:hypothetical protein